MIAALNIGQIVRGEMPLPLILHVGVDCYRHHGVNGKTIRNKSNCCIACERITRLNRNKKLASDLYASDNHMKALNLQEEKMRQDKDPLDIL